MLGYWASLGRPVYSYIHKGQTIPYISDVAAQELQPLFVTGCLVSVILLNISLVLILKARSAGPKPSVKLLRWKRAGISHTWFHYLAIFLTAAGSVGLVLLARFDRLQYPDLHREFLTLYV
ncbi:hypothetical protein P170DRAFT_430827 [Aspergillus steynii IBT 23096]|uniref:CWH43-like N-terminal domain-containing protein n=1 Tax=Aspergillus steynii IBT 23096 TaxID=1392250 RepID=A0A2I2FT61_9EURO|nr:uncharacterized protein P170DRAFT_430827 [Aspergillus steynii IBT 23096]PLB43806.1 hypothetical protein P170DRAFT_430827 [Aspergillus steynii IBT 23096]